MRRALSSRNVKAGVLPGNKRHRALARWTNSILKGRWIALHENTFVEDMLDSMVIVHLTAVIFDIDMINSGKVKICVRKHRTQATTNISACLAQFALQGVLVEVDPAEVASGNEEQIERLFLQMYRVYYAIRLPALSLEKIHEVDERLLAFIENTLSDFPDPTVRKLVEVELGFHNLTHNFPSNFRDGLLFAAVVHAKDPAAFGSRSWADVAALSPTQRLVVAFTTAESALKVPILMDAKDSMAPDPECIYLYVAALMDGFEAKFYSADEARKRERELEHALMDALKKRTAAQKLAEEHNDLRKLADRKFREEHEKLLEEVNKHQAVAESLKVDHSELRKQLNSYAVASVAQKWKGVHGKHKELRKEQEVEVARKQLTAALEESMGMGRKLQELSARVRFVEQDKQSQRPNLDAAPTGVVALMFTDVQGSTVQWEADPDTMATALFMHNVGIRKMLDQHDGYEVKTEGDAFMVAFQDPLQALRCALNIQLHLLGLDWPSKLLENPDSREEYDKEDPTHLLYRGLRVRIGIHIGEPRARPDPITGRMDYFGQMVNRAARTESLAKGGQIVVSQALFDAVKDALPDLDVADHVNLGNFEMKGIKGSTQLYQISPISLVNRVFMANRSSLQRFNLQQEVERARQDSEALRAALDQLMGTTKETQSHTRVLASNIFAVQTHPKGEFAEFQREAAMRMLTQQQTVDRIEEESKNLALHSEGLADDISLLMECVTSQQELSLVRAKESELVELHGVLASTQRTAHAQAEKISRLEQDKKDLVSMVTSAKRMATAAEARALETTRELARAQQMIMELRAAVHELRSHKQALADDTKAKSRLIHSQVRTIVELSSKPNSPSTSRRSSLEGALAEETEALPLAFISSPTPLDGGSPPPPPIPPFASPRSSPRTRPRTRPRSSPRSKGSDTSAFVKGNQPTPPYSARYRGGERTLRPLRHYPEQAE